MSMTIQQFCGHRLTLGRAPDDDSVTIADLAQFTEFDPGQARAADTAEHHIAFEALRAEYGGHEMIDGESDYYDGFWMRFRDGSEIRYRHN